MSTTVPETYIVSERFRTMATKLKQTTESRPAAKGGRTSASGEGKGLLAGLGPAALERVRAHMKVHEAEGRPLKSKTAKRT